QDEVANLRRFADQGNAEAQLFLGLIYETGDGVPRNHAEAAKWYRLAADQGNAEAQLFLGLIYETGDGVPRNHAEAAKWYRLADDHGNADAQSLLGSITAMACRRITLRQPSGVASLPKRSTRVAFAQNQGSSGSNLSEVRSPAEHCGRSM